MEEKINEIEGLISNLETMVFILRGGFTKEMIGEETTVRQQVDCYSPDGNDLQSVLDLLIEEHGDELVPTSFKKDDTD